jgi:outer membrane lipoprotein SlyB
VAGGVLGAVVGNQVGKGSGRAAATVLGAVGGGYVGHKVEERTRTKTVYQIAVRLENGSMRRFTRAQPMAVGTPVVLQGKGFRVDDGAALRAEGSQSRAQPSAVRVADAY